MNLRAYFLRRPLGRILHRLLIGILLLGMADINQHTVFGMPTVWIQALQADTATGVQSQTLRAGSAAVGHAVSPTVGWGLGILQGHWSASFPYLAGSRSAGYQFAQALPSEAAQPRPPACFSLVARAKSGKADLAWNHLPGTLTYEIYRAPDSEPLQFVQIGQVPGSSAAYADSLLPNEQTYLYFVRAVGPGVGCDSIVAAAHPTLLRGARNFPPVIYSLPPTTGSNSQEVQYVVRAVDPNPGDVVLYDLIDGPPGMVIDGANGELRWIAETGNHPVTVAAVDSQGAVDFQTFTLGISPPNLEVPDVVGLAQADAETALTTAGLTVGTVSLVHDAVVAAGVVILQDPVAGTSVAPGTAVDLVVSLGPTPVSVPDVVGLTQAAASAALIAADLAVGTLTTAHHPTAPAGTVISQVPVAGTAVAPGTAVDLVLSLGPVTVPVPEVVGLTQSAAEAAIVAAGLVVGTVTPAFHPTIPAGEVLEQSPAPATLVVLGTAVALTVSTGPSPVEVPDVVGLAQADAETALTIAGLTVGTVSLVHDAVVAAGVVILQDPVAGTSVAPGTAVDLVVSLGPTPVSVPDVVGLTQAAASAALIAADLAVGTLTTAHHPTAPAGTVISQVPVAGTAVAPGTAVDLVLSLGPVTVPVPEVVGLTQSAAEAAIVAAGLVVGTVTPAFHPTIPAGEVLEQSPAPATLVVLGTAVALTVSTGPSPVEVPDVVGLAQADAETALTTADLTVGTVSLVHDAVVAAGVVILQDPVAGTSVAPGTAVDLVVSLGPTPVSVPDVVGLTQAAASAALIAADLAVGTLTTAHHPTAPAGTVISQVPVAGTAVAPGTAVDLVLSLGPVTVPVPEVVGLTQSAAEAAIVAAGLVVGTVTPAFHPTIPAGEVLEQSPAPATLVVLGTAVALTVSTGPSPVEVPDVVGLAQADAETALTTADLTVGTVSLVHDAVVAAGVVILQDPVAGTSVAPGTAVDLVVSLGPTPVSVPDVVGLTQAAASAALIAADLAVGTLTTAHHPTAPAGTVISQVPVAGTAVAPGTAVDLVLSLGPVTVPVPEVVGLTQSAAEAAIVAAGLVVGTVTPAFHPTIPAGEVLEQSPAPATLVVLGTAVALTVSAGPSPVEVPDVVGLAQADAETALTTADLTVGTVSLVHDAVVAAGVVILQDPVAGTSVAPGTAVDLVVSLGPTPVSVPDVVGLTQAAASAALIAADLAVGTLTTAHHPTAPAGTVISQVPVAGTAVAPGTAVNLVLSLGPVTVPVPEVVGLTQSAAEAAIVAAGLVVGTVTPAFHPTIPAGEVLEQSPAPATLVVLGTAVALTVSAGPGSADLLRPQVTLTANATVVDPGTILTLTVVAVDDVGVVSTLVRVNGSEIALNASGQATFTSAVAGIFLAEAIATDAAGNAGNATLELRFLASGDSVPPTVALTAPSDGAVLTLPTEVIGTATDNLDLARYILEYAPQGETVFVRFAEGTEPVSNGVLGTFDPTLLRNGTYVIRLTAEDASGRSSSVTRLIQTEGEAKVGNFALRFEDITVPVAGIPITITRTYDSRVKTKGDFGVGWQLSFSDVKLSENGVLGEGWTQTRSGSFLPVYSLQPTRAHRVTVNFPDGRIAEFDMRLNPTSSTLFPFSLLIGTTASFAPAAGTVGSLTSLANNSLVVNGPTIGAVTLVDDILSIDSYDPDHYRMTDADGSQYVIRQGAGLESIVDPNGNTITIGSGGILHSAGKSVLFSRDAASRITSITDPNGNVLRYDYDSYGDLVAFTDAEGHVTRFRYNFSHGLVETIDPRGVRASRSEYDSDGRLVAMIDADGHRVEFDHDIEGRQEIVRDRLGHVTVHAYDERGNVTQTVDALGQVTSRSYDANDNETSVTDPLGNTTTRSFDANGKLLTETDPLGHVTRYTYDAGERPTAFTDALGHTQNFAYDARGNVLASTDPEGRTTTYTYDARGNLLSETDPLGTVTRHSYDGFGNRIRTIVEDALGVELRENRYTHDANGNVLTESLDRTLHDGTLRTATTTFEYDGLNRLTRTLHSDGSSVTLTYNAIGKKASQTDELGRTTQYRYDNRGNLVETILPNGASEREEFDAENRRIRRIDARGQTTSYTYDAVGRLVATTFPDGSIVREDYDAAGRVIAKTDASGNVTRYEYDAAGRRIRTIDALGNITAFTYNAAGLQTSVTDANGNTFVIEYDARNQPVRTTFPDSTTRQTTYDAVGRVATETDQSGHTITYQYDGLGRLIRVTDALAGVTRNTYDEAGNLRTQTDAEGRTTEFRYDDRGRRVARILPGGQIETYVYDAAGNLISRTDFNGHTTTYAYDAHGLLVSKAADPSHPSLALSHAPARLQFAYDAGGLRISQTVLNQAGATLHQETYAHDPMGRMVRKTTPDGELTYAYNGAGNLELVRSDNPGGLEVAYAYDALNRVARVIEAGGDSTYAYDPVGNLASLTYPNGIIHAWSYDSLNRLNLLTVGTAGVSGSIRADAYTLAPNGQRTRVVEGSGRTVDYVYDALGRLTVETVTGSATGLNGQASYAYDRVGNRQTRSATLPGLAPQTLAYDVNDRLASHVYDANGNTLTSAGETDQYDFENRLIRRTESDGTIIDLTYDADGNRVGKRIAGTEERYLVDIMNLTGHAQVVEERTAGATLTTYVYGLDLVSRRTSAGARHYYAYDGQGSVRHLLDTTGTVTDAYDYDAFGVLIDWVGSTPNRYLFAGEQYDSDLELYFLRARYLDANVGRFRTMDTFEGVLRDPATLHKYLYAHADPVNRIDPSGHFSLGSVVATVAIAGIINALIGGIFNIGQAFSDPKTFWGDRAKDFAIGALLAPVGGLFARIFAPIVRASMGPLLQVLGNVSRITLVGRAGVSRMLVNISRWLFNTNRSYPPVGSTFLGSIMKRIFPSVRWEQHHVLIQQAWSRVGGPNQIYDDLVANEGLRRLGNGLWNLLPIPRSLNAALGRSEIGTQLFATAYYSLITFGTSQTIIAFSDW